MGINNDENIIIKPYAMYEELNYGKNKVADFYYTFTCQNGEKEPTLLFNIVPTFHYDNSFSHFIKLLCNIGFISIITLACYILCSYENYYQFVSGCVLGYIVITNNCTRIYCE